MATSVMNGSNLKMKVGGAVVDDLTSTSISFSMEPRDVTSKDDAGVRKLGEGKTSGSISFEGVHIDGATTGLNTLYTSYGTRAEIAWIFNSSAASGEDYFSGNGYITSLSLQGGVEDNVTYSGTIEVSSAITKNTVT